MERNILTDSGPVFNAIIFIIATTTTTTTTTIAAATAPSALPPDSLINHAVMKL